MNRPTITAHSGCEGTQDGSMTAILRGIELRADLVEIDVRHVHGLGLALTHNATDDASGLVTLDEAFHVLAKHPSMGVNCDLKESGLAQDVMALASACGVAEGQLAFSGSLAPADLAADPSICSRARVYLNIEQVLCELFRTAAPDTVPLDAEPWDVVESHMPVDLGVWLDPIIETCLRLRVTALNLPLKPFIQPWLARLGAAGVRSSVWTVNDEKTMRELLSMQWLSNLTTRQVALAMSVRASQP